MQMQDEPDAGGVDGWNVTLPVSSLRPNVYEWSSQDGISERNTPWRNLKGEAGVAGDEVDEAQASTPE